MDLIDKARIDKYIASVRWQNSKYYNGFKYWTMGDPMDSTWVLNRTDDMKIYK